MTDTDVPPLPSKGNCYTLWGKAGDACIYTDYCGGELDGCTNPNDGDGWDACDITDESECPGFTCSPYRQIIRLHAWLEKAYDQLGDADKFRYLVLRGLAGQVDEAEIEAQLTDSERDFLKGMRRDVVAKYPVTYHVYWRKIVFGALEVGENDIPSVDFDPSGNGCLGVFASLEDAIEAVREFARTRGDTGGWDSPPFRRGDR